jgi:hypothetical protein
MRDERGGRRERVERGASGGRSLSRVTASDASFDTLRGRFCAVCCVLSTTTVVPHRRSVGDKALRRHAALRVRALPRETREESPHQQPSAKQQLSQQAPSVMCQVVQVYGLVISLERERRC